MFERNSFTEVELRHSSTDVNLNCAKIWFKPVIICCKNEVSLNCSASWEMKVLSCLSSFLIDLSVKYCHCFRPKESSFRHLLDAIFCNVLCWLDFWSLLKTKAPKNLSFSLRTERERMLCSYTNLLPSRLKRSFLKFW